MLDFDLVARVRKDLATEATNLWIDARRVEAYGASREDRHRSTDVAVCAEACEQAHRAITHALTQLAEHLDNEQAREALR